MEQIAKPANYKKLLKAVIKSFDDTEYEHKIIVQPIYIGFKKHDDYSINRHFHYFFTVSEYDKQLEIWVDIVDDKGNHYDAEKFDLNLSMNQALIKGIMSKEFKNFNILFGNK